VPRVPLASLLCAVALVLGACGEGGGSGSAAAGGSGRSEGSGATVGAERSGPPAPHATIPRGPVRLSARLAATSADLRRGIAAWRATHPGRRARPPRDVLLLALHVQRIDRLLAKRPRLSARTLRRLPPRARAEAADSAGALRSLFRLTTRPTEARFRVGPPQPPGVLRGYYRAAQRRFGVSWRVLAAINLIETNYGRLRNVSSAGAVGPMQFLPSTWQTVGLGGDIHDPHDAILGAANYLRLSGAPDYRRAVFAYNPSPLYVDAVLRFAHRIRRDPTAFYAYWSWQSFRRTGHGDVQLTGPGAR
jgi:Transglycosylase SLT domain